MASAAERAAWGFGAALLVFYAALLASPYELRLLAVAGSYALLVLGYQFVFGHAGALSLAQGSFFGLGAYVSAVLATRLGWSFPATFPLAILAPAALAALVAVPVLRLRSHYFALATLGVAQVALLAATEWTGVTGGANGISGIPPITVLGHALPRGLPTALAAWGAVAAGAVLSWRLLAGPGRLAFAMMREAPEAAAALAIDAARLRFAAFLLSAAYGGAAGALHVHTLGVVSPEALGFSVMVTCLAMTVLGGSTRIAGAVIGALLLVHVPEWLRVADIYRNIAYGAALLAMIVLAPSGIAGFLEMRRREVLPTPVLLPALPAAVAFTPLLQAESVSKRFGGVVALNEVGLELARGEILGLIGPNGSGKTTLVNIVSGFVPADAGQVRLGGEPIDHLPPEAIARRGIARSFQVAAALPGMTVLDSVALARAAATGRARLGGSAADLTRCRGEAMHLLGGIGIADTALAPIATLPAGTRRRAELARALALQPALLLLDEPAAGLTPAERDELAALLRRLAGEGVAILVVEHDMGFLMTIADRLVCLDRGRVIAAGTPDEVRDHPAVIEAYLGLAA